MRLLTNLALLGPALLLVVTGCTAGQGLDDQDGTEQPRGPVTFWYVDRGDNTNAERAWATIVGATLNQTHPDQPAQLVPMPSGASWSDTVTTAVDAGTAPCGVIDAPPSAVGALQAKGDLIDLSDLLDATSYIETRSGPTAPQYRSPDGDYFQLPWVTRPVMLMYNKQVFRAAGLDPDSPQLSSYADVIAAARAIKKTGAAPYVSSSDTSSPAATATEQFLPFYAAASAGSGLLVDGRARFDDSAGRQVAAFWRTLYADKAIGTASATVDTFADGRTAMKLVGPEAVEAYLLPVDEGIVPVPPPTGTSALNTFSASGAASIVLLKGCPHVDTAWDLVTYVTENEQERLLAWTGLIPIRNNQSTSYRDLYPYRPSYFGFADQAELIVEVPINAHTEEMLSILGDAYDDAVVRCEIDPTSALRTAAAQVTALAR